MYSLLHSHLTAVAIDFFLKYTLEQLDRLSLGGEVGRTAIIRPKTPVHM